MWRSYTNEIVLASHFLMVMVEIKTFRMRHFLKLAVSMGMLV